MERAAVAVCQVGRALERDGKAPLLHPFPSLPVSNPWTCSITALTSMPAPLLLWRLPPCSDPAGQKVKVRVLDDDLQGINSPDRLGEVELDLKVRLSSVDACAAGLAPLLALLCRWS